MPAPVANCPPRWCVIRHLRARAAKYHLDPNRIVALGVSAGGHLADLLGTANETAGWEVGECLDQSSSVPTKLVIVHNGDHGLQGQGASFSWNEVLKTLFWNFCKNT
ncbi:MAG: hypothetical protein ACUVRJ_04095 [Candidatus Villigracilaceae bacterium]